MTRDEFIDGYMARSRIPSIRRTATGYEIENSSIYLCEEAVPCDCGIEYCEGWRMEPVRRSDAPTTHPTPPTAPSGDPGGSGGGVEG